MKALSRWEINVVSALGAKQRCVCVCGIMTYFLMDDKTHDNAVCVWKANTA